MGSRPPKRGRAHTIIANEEANDDDKEQLAPTEQPPTPEFEDNRRYPTRNPNRRPGKHVGLNWEQDQRQQQAAATAKAKQKKERDAQKAVKERKADHHAQGIKHIAELEAAREAEDDADDEYLQTRTAVGYHFAAKVAGSAGDLQAVAEDSGSDFRDEDEDDMDDDEEAEDEGEEEVTHATLKQAKVTVPLHIMSRHDHCS